MEPVHRFNVIPSLPAPREGPRRLFDNLPWAIGIRGSARFDGLSPSEVAGQLYLERLTVDGGIAEPVAVSMLPSGRDAWDEFHVFEAKHVVCSLSPGSVIRFVYRLCTPTRRDPFLLEMIR